MKSHPDYNLLPLEEQKRLLLDRDNVESRNKLASSFFLMARHAALKVCNQRGQWFADNYLDDLTQEGMTGVLHAVKKFDLSRINEIRFSTYCWNWIRQRIQTYSIESTWTCLRMTRHSKSIGSKYRDSVFEMLEKTRSIQYHDCTDIWECLGVDDGMPNADFRDWIMERLAAIRDYRVRIGRSREEADRMLEREKFVIECLLADKSTDYISQGLGVSRQRVNQIRNRMFQLLLIGTNMKYEDFADVIRCNYRNDHVVQ